MSLIKLTTPLVRTLLLGALTLASVAGCSSTGYVLEDIGEGAMRLVGKGTTAAERLERIEKTHDRSAKSVWHLLPTDDTVRPLKRALREVSILEEKSYSHYLQRTNVMILLADYPIRSDSMLIRGRFLQVVIRLAAPLELNRDGVAVGDYESMTPLFAKLDATWENHETSQSSENRAARLAVVEKIAAFRFWPLDEPLRDSKAKSLARIERIRRISGLIARNVDDLSTLPIDSTVAGGLRSLSAELARLVAAHALIFDPAETVRGDAVESFVELADVSVVGLLASAAGEEREATVRRRIASALGMLGGGAAQRPITMPALLDLSEDPESDVRHQALESLRSIAGSDHGSDGASWRAWWENGRKADDSSPDE